MAERDIFYLWHLEHLGLITRTTGGWASPLWDAAQDADPVTVAIIDSGLDPLHPNLRDALSGPQIDFGPTGTGAVYRDAGKGVADLRQALATSQGDLKALVTDALADLAAHVAGHGINLGQLEQLHDAVQGADNPTAAAQAFADAIGVQPAARPAVVPDFGDIAGKIAALDLGADHNAALTAIAGQMAGGFAQIDLPDPASYFGAHGTACAGLVGGRPPRGHSHTFFSALPYFGVNPFCTIASYATPYSHEIRPVIAALLAAYLGGAQVILMPRGLPDVATRASLPPSPRRLTRIEHHDSSRPETLVHDDQASLPALMQDQTLIEALLLAIAKRRYLILAAGNEGQRHTLAYPATVAGLVDQAVVVAAVTRAGQRASYSSGTPEPAALLHMPSDDAEVLNRDDQRIDIGSFDGSDYNIGGRDTKGLMSGYTPWAPLSLDVRGAYGFAASAQRDVPDYDDGVDIASLYTLFGGTSAAAAQAAGLISLLVQTGRLPATPAGGAMAIVTAMQEAGLHHDYPPDD
ncbi:S8 family serine peptidase [Loktanella sp. R86503]|uniref:S8 family serine peptidase n=1 Tax=Loktanella sp. R86503 TaxID=3093847 RepID=UPI0036D8AE4C